MGLLSTGMEVEIGSSTVHVVSKFWNSCSPDMILVQGQRSSILQKCFKLETLIRYLLIGKWIAT